MVIAAVGEHHWAFKAEMKLLSKVINRVFWVWFLLSRWNIAAIQQALDFFAFVCICCLFGVWTLNSRWKEHGWFWKMEKVTSRL